MSGVIQGGWEFVIAAYLVTAAVLGGYATTVFVHYRSEKDRRERQSGR